MGDTSVYIVSGKNEPYLLKGTSLRTSCLPFIALVTLEALYVLVEPPSVILVIQSPLGWWYIGDISRPLCCEKIPRRSGSLVRIANLDTNLGKFKDEP